MECLFELHWELKEIDQGILHDPHYKLLPGRFFDRIARDYPTHEELPTAAVPEELMAHSVQHRFRVGPEKWPLVQIGPGVLSVNSTADYTWEDFEPRVTRAVAGLYDAYPDAEKSLRPEKLVLRYIDALDFDYSHDNVLAFMERYMRTTVRLPDALFAGGEVSQPPAGCDVRIGFHAARPKSTVNVRFVTGKNSGRDALIWETMVISDRTQISFASRDQISAWVKEAHKITGDWFFKLIDGDLLARFK